MATDSLKSKSVTIRFNCTKRILFDYQTHGDPSRSYTIGRVAKLMGSTTTVTLLHIRQYGYLP